MMPEQEWASAKPTKADIAAQKTLGKLKTEELTCKASQIKYAGTDVIEDTIKGFARASSSSDNHPSTEEAVEQMRTWLKTGIAPDGTRMMTDEASQWFQDFYQYTAKTDVEHECLPEGSLVDYYYWTAPFLSHIGNIDLVMMHSQVNLRDGTHLPCDRLRETTKTMKNLDKLAQQRLDKQQRVDAAFVAEAMNAKASRGHPLRKDGIYTKYLWKPFHQRTIEERYPAAKKAVHAEKSHTDESAIMETDLEDHQRKETLLTSTAAPERTPTVVLEARAKE